MTFTRRSFLLGSAALLGSRWLARAAKPNELIIGAVQYAIEGGAMSRALIAIDSAGKRYAKVALDFHFHGFAPHPAQRQRAVLFEKKGPGACEVDLLAKQVVRPLRTSEDRQFYGHGAFSLDGKQLYATESILKTGEGVIVLRDGATLAQSGEFPTYGSRPHDCVLIDRGRTLVITNGGGTLEETDAAPSITFVDVATRKLREKLPFDNPRLNAGHLALTSRRELVVISAPRSGLPNGDLGGISLRAPGAPLKQLTEPAEVTHRMIGETLSLAIHEPSHVVAVTTPDADLVTFWNYQRGKLVKSLKLDHPRGITLTRDQRYFAVSHGAVTPVLSYLSTTTLEPDAARTVADAHLSGSHMYTWVI